jgi:hypothetical protein
MELTVSRTDIPSELQRLVQLKMIRAVPKEPRVQRQYYERLPSPLWHIVEVAVKEAPNA